MSHAPACERQYKVLMLPDPAACFDGMILTDPLPHFGFDI